MDDEELARIAERLVNRRTELKDNVDAAITGENSAGELLDRVKRLQVRLASTIGGHAPSAEAESSGPPTLPEGSTEKPSDS